MTEKNYPTRMHEVLGVETKELFAIKGSEGQFYLNDNGDFRFVRDLDKWATDDVNPYSITKAINYGITRRPRLTEEQADQLKALVTLGYRWLVEERGGTVVAVNHEVKKGEVRWVLTNPRDSDDVVCDVHQSLSVKSLVSWSDPAPLDIVQTLRGAGVSVEVEG